MKKIWWLVIILALVGAVLLGRKIFAGRKKGALSVNTSPRATVFLDGEHLGSTPYYNESLKPGEFVLKVVPEAVGQALTPWEGRVSLSPGILTVVNREMGLTQDDSAGEILSFEPLADKSAVSISVVTTPDGAVVNLDGEPRGFAPLTLDNLTEGDHILLVSSPGFKERTIKAKTVKGHKLIASVQLAREITPPVEAETEAATPAASPKASPSPTATPKASPTSSLPRPYVVIKSATTGWVRVRSEPSTSGEELAKVNDGESFPLKDEQSGWYQIEYDTAKLGWISGQYAEKFE